MERDSRCDTRLNNRNPQDTLLFRQALGGFRASMGVQIAVLCTVYQLDVEDELAQILPPGPSND